jgi:diguanylate cyclase (GGDEF)-like protein
MATGTADAIHLAVSGSRLAGQSTVPVRQMARAIGLLYSAGAVLALVWVVLPRSAPHPNVAVVAACAIVALLQGLLLSAGLADRSPLWTFHPVIAGIQVVIAVAYATGGGATNDVRLFFIWATPFAMLFFPVRAALAHVIWTALCLSAAMGAGRWPLRDDISVWLMTMGTTVAVACLVGWVTARVRVNQSRLHDAATRDPLTGLPNRRVFTELVDAALGRARSAHGRVMLLLIDLDRFKVVNDTHGHQAGDALLRAVAPRLRHAIRPGDLVARLGGDEFAVLIEDPDRALSPAEAAARLSAVWDVPVELSEGTLYTSGTIGVAVSEDGADTAGTLLRDADSAMYRAKRRAPGSVAVFEASMRAGAERRFEMERALREAIGHGQLHLEYQPVVDLGDATTAGAETLLRWDHPTLGAVEPERFVSLAEETGLIVPIGRWVLERTIEMLGQPEPDGRRAPPGGPWVSVNVSPLQFGGDLVELIADLLAANGVTGQRLVIELTETALMDTASRPGVVLSQLQALGVRVLLDDFGTGYSSLSYLNRFRLDGIKIDKAFVSAMVDSDQSASLAASIIAMGKALGIPVIAEGIETVEQLELLRQLGCGFGQGYLLGRPRPRHSLRVADLGAAR